MAALLVLFWHGVPAATVGGPAPLSILREGHTGVSLFCVLSGFILTYIYFDKQISYGEFLKRRLLRIAPMFLVYVLIAFYTTSITVADVFSALTVVATKHTQLATWVTGHTWSVLVEAQFYLVFPFLLAFARGKGVKYLAGWLLLMVIIRASIFHQQGFVQEQGYWTVLGRMDQFLCGAMAAVAVRRGWFDGQAARSAAVGAGVLGCIAIVAYFWWWRSQLGGFLAPSGTPHSWRAQQWIWIPTLEGACYTAILLGYVLAPWKEGQWLRPAFDGLAFLGRISYSIYINQYLVLGWGIPALILPASWMVGWLRTMLAVIVIDLPILTLFSTFTYYLIELPFMKLRDRREPVPRAEDPLSIDAPARARAAE